MTYQPNPELLLIAAILHELDCGFYTPGHIQEYLQSLKHPDLPKRQISSSECFEVAQYMQVMSTVEDEAIVVIHCSHLASFSHPEYRAFDDGPEGKMLAYRQFRRWVLNGIDERHVPSDEKLQELFENGRCEFQSGAGVLVLRP